MSLAVTSDSVADPMSDAADNWVETLAEKEAEDILREIEKNIGLDPDLKGNLKGSIKGFLKGKLKDSFLPKAHTLAMQEIIDKIQDALNDGTRRRLCDTAAVNQAHWAASQVRRSLTGAAEVLVELLESVGGVGSLAKDLAEKAARTLGKEIADRVRKALEEALDDYIKNYKVETFTRNISGASCSMTIRVIWNKQRGRYHYAIFGNCNCKPVSAKGKRKVLLERWRVTGRGGAAWVGEEEERRRTDASVPSSAIRGLPTLPSVRVKSVCCGADGNACAVPPNQDPYIFVPSGTGTRPPRPTTGTTPNTGRPPTTGTTGGNTGTGTKPAEPEPPSEPTNPISGRPLSEDQGKIEVPEIPAGPLCPSDKEKVIEAASKAFTSAGNLVTKLERDYMAASANGENTPEAQTAKTALDKAKELKDQAAKALDEAYQIPEQKECHPTHEGDDHSMVLPDSSDHYVSRLPTDLGISIQGPETCRAGSYCRYSLILTNDGPSEMYGALPISMASNTVITAVKPNTEGWHCMTGKGGFHCYNKHMQLGSEEFTGLELDVRFASSSRNRHTRLCANSSDIWRDSKSGPKKNRTMVQLLQHTLTIAGYKPGRIDGQMGIRTLRAANKFAKQNFCQIPEVVSDDMLAKLLGGSIIYAVAQQTCVSTSVTANRKPTRKKSSSSGSNWPGIILHYGIQRELHRKHKRERRDKYKKNYKREPREEYKREYKSSPKSEYNEVVPKKKYMECDNGKCY